MEEHPTAIGWLFAILILICVLAFIADDYDSKLTVKEDGTFHLVESKYLFGGSWFNKNAIGIDDFDSIIYVSRSLWGNKKTIFPVSRILEMKYIFIKTGTYKMSIVSCDGCMNKTQYTVYMNNKKTFIDIKKLFSTLIPPTAVVIEETSILF